MAEGSIAHPLESNQTIKHGCIRAVFLSQFDIDKGTVMVAQYPDNIVSTLKPNDPNIISEFMLPEGSHRVNEDFNIFFLNRSSTIVKIGLEEEWELVDDHPKLTSPHIIENQSPVEPLLYCLNLVIHKTSPSLKRGSLIQAMAIACEHQFIHMYKALLWNSLEKCFGGTEILVSNTLRSLYDIINEIPVQPLLQLRSDYLLFWNSFQPDSLQIPIKIDSSTNMSSSSLKNDSPTESHGRQFALPDLYFPLDSLPDAIDGASVLLLFETFKESIMDIYNAILLDEPIAFLGHHETPSLLNKFVLSTALLVRPLKVLGSRIFPQINFGYEETITAVTKAPIFGTANPFIEDRGDMWHLLCNITTGQITRHPQTRIPTNTSATDSIFLKSLSQGIVGGGESFARNHFAMLTLDIINCSLAVGKDRTSERSKMTPFMDRVVKWSQTTSYKYYMQHQYTGAEDNSISGDTLASFMRRLLKAKREEELDGLFQQFVERIDTEAMVLELYSVAGMYGIDFKRCLEKMKQVTLRVKFKLDWLEAKRQTIAHKLIDSATIPKKQ